MNDFKPLNINRKDYQYSRLFFSLGLILGFFICILLFSLFVGFVGHTSIALKENFPIESVPTPVYTPPSQVNFLQRETITGDFSTPQDLVFHVAGDHLYKFVEESPGCYQIVLIAKTDYVSVNSRDEVLGSHSVLSDEELIAGYQLMNKIMHALYKTSSFSTQTLSVSVRLAALAQYSSNPEQIEIMYDGAQGSLPIALAQKINWEGITLNEFRYLVSDYLFVQ